jgi:hypothetical protein
VRLCRTVSALVVVSIRGTISELFAPLNFHSFHLLMNARNSMLARKL